jgi:hypothetical protein
LERKGISGLDKSTQEQDKAIDEGSLYLVLYLEVPDCGFRDDCGCWDKGYSEQTPLVVEHGTRRWHLRRPSEAM